MGVLKLQMESRASPDISQLFFWDVFGISSQENARRYQCFNLPWTPLFYVILFKMCSVPEERRGEERRRAMEKPERFWLGISGELAGLGLGVLLRPHWLDPVTGRWVACPCWHSALLPFVERRLCPLCCVSSWEIQGGIWRLSGDWIWGVVDLLWPRHHLEAAHTLLVGRLCSFVVFRPYDPGLLGNFCGVKEYQSQQIRILLCLLSYPGVIFRH